MVWLASIPLVLTTPKLSGVIISVYKIIAQLREVEYFAQNSTVNEKQSQKSIFRAWWQRHVLRVPHRQASIENSCYLLSIKNPSARINNHQNRQVWLSDLDGKSEVSLCLCMETEDKRDSSGDPQGARERRQTVSISLASSDPWHGKGAGLCKFREMAGTTPYPYAPCR